jgi:hypothetical protein
MDIDKIKKTYIQEQPLEERPEFYGSMSNNPSTNRFAGDASLQNQKVIKVTEYSESTSGTGLIVFPLRYTYSTRPIIRILVKYITGAVEQYDANMDITIDNEAKTLEVDTGGFGTRAYAIARIYSLDNY